jgi:hypothetical protein
MISYRDLMERLSDFVGGHLPPRTLEAVQQHLDDCPSCRDYLEGCQLAAHLGAEAPCPPLPEHLKMILGEPEGK